MNTFRTNDHLRDTVKWFYSAEHGAITPVLKSHLLIESLLRTSAYHRMARPAMLTDVRFQFPQLLAIAQASVEAGADLMPWVWTAAEQLNALRNSLAHRPDGTDLLPKASRFMATVINEMDDKQREMFGVVPAWKDDPFGYVTLVKSRVTKLEVVAVNLFAALASALDISLGEVLGNGPANSADAQTSRPAGRVGS